MWIWYMIGISLFLYTRKVGKKIMSVVNMDKGILNQESYCIKEECKRLRDKYPEDPVIRDCVNQIESSINDINYFGLAYGEALKER